MGKDVHPSKGLQFLDKILFVLHILSLVLVVKGCWVTGLGNSSALDLGVLVSVRINAVVQCSGRAT